VAKLHQDLTGGWYRRQGAPISRAVLGFVSQAVLDATIARDPEYELVHRPLLACTFARILPYVDDDRDRRMILERVEYFASGTDQSASGTDQSASGTDQSEGNA
jgi:hypothetical protein